MAKYFAFSPLSSDFPSSSLYNPFAKLLCSIIFSKTLFKNEYGGLPKCFSWNFDDNFGFATASSTITFVFSAVTII